MSHRNLQGIGFAEMCDQVAKDLERVHEEAKWTNDGGECEREFTRVPARVWLDWNSGLWMAAPVEAQPFVGFFQARGRDAGHAKHELRFVHARAWHEKGGMDWDKARAHCARYVYDFEGE